MLKRKLTFIFLILFAFQGFGQSFISKRYNEDNSPLEGNLSAVYQDAQGSMWWVADEKFVKYNGVVFTPIPFAAITNGYDTYMTQVDAQGTPWLLAIKGSKNDIFRYESGWRKITTFVNGSSDEAMLGFHVAQTEGKLWLVSNKRLLAWDKEWNEALPGDGEARILRYTGYKNTLYVFIPNGVYTIKWGEKADKLDFPPTVSGSILTSAANISSENPSGPVECWVTSENWLGVIKNSVLTVVKFFDAPQAFNMLRYDGVNRVYLSDGLKVWSYDIKKAGLYPIALSSRYNYERINALGTDYENTLWVCTDDGVIKISNQSISLFSKNDGLAGVPIQAVCIDAGQTLWAAGPRGISAIADNKIVLSLSFNNTGLNDSKQLIKELKADKKGNVWILSDTKGLWRFDGHSKLAKELSPGGKEFTSFTLDEQQGNILASTYEAVYERVNNAWYELAKIPSGVSVKQVWYYNDALVCLTSKGIFKLEDADWKRLDEPGQRLEVQANAMYKIYENLAVVGTQNGIYYLKEFSPVKYQPDSVSTRLSVYAMLTDAKGRVWIATDTGVLILEKKGAPKMLAYSGFKFVPGQNSPMAIDADGRAWVAHRNGVVCYRTESTAARAKPILNLTRIEAGDSTFTNFANTARVELGSKDNDLTFYFDAASFIDEANNKILYKLEGYQNNWQELVNPRDNRIIFRNLNPGRYVLKIQLVSAGGVISDVQSSPLIAIKRPFYNQWWFYGSIILIFFGLSFAGFYLYGQKKFEKDLISEVDRRSKELRSSEERFKTIWVNSSDALVLYSLDGEILIYNEAFRHLLDTQQSLTGRKLFDVLNINTDRPDHRLIKERLSAMLLDRHLELRARVAQKDVFLEFSNTYIKLANDKSSVMLSIIRNITLRKQMEESLIEARDEAERASKLKSAFLATMSHEIRTPLNAIIGMSSVMRDTTLSEEQRSYINAIKTSSDSLLSLVNNILDFSKIEAGMMKIEKTEFMPEECLTETLEILGNLANEKGIHLYYKIDPKTPVKIISDKTRLRQILINLVGNAIKFTDNGFVEIWLRPSESGVLSISVTDTGIGIPENRKADLFKVFTQVDASTTRKYGGTGLGLAITDKLVQLLGGEISVASQMGSGSSFTFTIRNFSKAQRYIMRTDTLKKFRGIKVGIISQKQAIFNLFKALNEERDIKTLVARNADELDEALNESDILLLDVESMPPDIEPEQLADKNVVPVKRNLHELPAKIAGKIKYREVVNLPVNTADYEGLLEKMLKQGSSTAAGQVVAEEKLGNLIPLKILVADDNRINLMMMEVILKNMGYATDFANNGIEAVDKCLAEDYDLVFMDVQMPEMDGLDASRKIIEEKPNRIPVIVALTANAFPEDKEACLAAGMKDFLPKPVNVEMINNVIEKWFVQGEQAAG